MTFRLSRLVGCLLLAIAVRHPQAQTTRDASQTPAVGRSSVSGTVLSVDGQPLARAAVALTEASSTNGRTTLADDKGAFTFPQLAAGRYRLTASKAGYLAAQYGQKKPLHPGTLLGVAEGTDIQSLELRMVRGGIIAGTVTDHVSQPAPDTTVRALRIRYGSSGVFPEDVATTRVDDRGQYRITNLPPGAYAVLAQPPVGADLLFVDVDGAQPQRRDALAPVFFPGVFSSSEAAPIPVRAGEERGGTDIQLRLVPTVSVRGQVTGPGGPAASARVMLTRSDDFLSVFAGSLNQSTDGQGRFTFPKVVAGRYRLVAVNNQDATFGETKPNDAWSVTEITIGDRDVTDLSLTLVRTASVQGRVAFSTTGPPPAPDLFGFTLSPLPSMGLAAGFHLSHRRGSTGAIALNGAPPGRYILSATGQMPVGWYLKSVAVGGREVPDRILDISGDITDLVVTCTDVPTQVVGKVVDADQKPAAGCTLILFPADAALWATSGWRIAWVGASAEGLFLLDGPIPGSYLLAAADDPDQGQWWDPAFLNALRPEATPVTIVEGQKVVQNLVLKRR